MRATGLTKGGLYNHFASKDEIAIAAFDYAYKRTSAKVLRTVARQTGAIAKLEAMIAVHLDYIDNSLLPGGCPILNTAVESDDTHPILRKHAAAAMDAWRGLIVRIVREGIAEGEIKADVQAQEVATIMISTIEGAIMMSKLYSDAVYLKTAVGYLQDYVAKKSTL
jgi:AcrR family transcriptional regulator